MERVNKHTNIDEIKAVVDRYPWWSAARLTLARNQSDEERDAATRLIASLHPTALATLRTIDTAQLTHLTTDDLIDRTGFGDKAETLKAAIPGVLLVKDAE